MFLQQLYWHSKWMFTLVIIVITTQLFINFKRGMVVTPLYHYGMYSEAITPKQAYQVFEIFVNGKQLQGKDFTPWQWDKIVLPLTYYSGIPKSNQMYEEDIKRLLIRLHLEPRQKRFLSTCDYAGFEHWYQLYLTSVLGEKVRNIEVKYRRYSFNTGVLQPTQNVQQLPDLCH
jgi:hypothetical protein